MALEVRRIAGSGPDGSKVLADGATPTIINVADTGLHGRLAWAAASWSHLHCPTPQEFSGVV